MFASLQCPTATVADNGCEFQRAGSGACRRHNHFADDAESGDNNLIGKQALPIVGGGIVVAAEDDCRLSAPLISI